MSSVIQPTVPEYQLSAPTEECARAALARVLGPAQAERVWSSACRQLELQPGDVGSDLGRLRDIAERLAAQPGLAGPMGVALQVRVRTYECLAELARPTGGGSDV